MMSRAFVWTICMLGTATACSAIAGAPAFTSGAWIYEKKCAVCHGSEGLGDGPMADALTPPPSNLTVLRRQAGGEFPYSRVYQIIDGRVPAAGHGTSAMPIWGDYFRAEALLPATREPGIDVDEIVHRRITALVEYIESIQK